MTSLLLTACPQLKVSSTLAGQGEVETSVGADHTRLAAVEAEASKEGAVEEDQDRECGARNFAAYAIMQGASHQCTRGTPYQSVPG